MILNDDSGSELCTDKDYGFEGDDGVDLITWTSPAEKVTKGTGIFLAKHIRAVLLIGSGRRSRPNLVDGKG